jgi:hypothetical protein
MSCGCGCNGTVHTEALELFTHLATITATPGKDGGATAPIDTRGADLLIVHASIGVAAGVQPVVSDSQLHNWIPLSTLDGAKSGHRTWYVKNAFGHQTHTFSVMGTDLAPAIIVHAFQGSDRLDPLQLSTGAMTMKGTALATNSVTPASHGSLVLSWFSSDLAAPETGNVSDGLALNALPQLAGTNWAASTGYRIQQLAAPINPIWYWPNEAEAQVGIAVFKPGSLSTPIRPPNTLTARDIITATLRSVRVLGVGDPLDANDANDALHRLNDWLDSLALERLTMYYVARTTKLLANGISNYTIGIGGDINISRPTHIESANLIFNVHDPVVYEKPIDVWTEQRWQGCRQKTLESTYPTAVYYDHNWKDGLGKVYLWPVPTDCGLTELVLYTPVALLEFPTLDTAFSFPPGYRRFIRTNFAAEIASEYGKQLTSDQVLAARQAKAQIKRGNVRPAELRVDAALVRGYDYFDWRTGEPR